MRQMRVRSEAFSSERTPFSTAPREEAGREIIAAQPRAQAAIPMVVIKNQKVLPLKWRFEPTKTETPESTAKVETTMTSRVLSCINLLFCNYSIKSKKSPKFGDLFLKKVTIWSGGP